MSLMPFAPLRSKAFAFLLTVAPLSMGALGCSKSYIPNTDVEDTGENRKIIKFCEDYRHAVEERNVGRLLSMVSPQYHEDGGNSAGDDDLDYDGYKEFMTSVFQQTTNIRYEIRYRRVTITETNKVFVDYTYAASFRIPGVKAQEWKHTVADNRLELVPEGESFKILAGM
ncbi:hypothetical protein LZC95_23015 [Pendulispora brunnea]|uniref:SnoaL-like domain-containing protein n=1 Tax=Pendulispora brunnea TaxID=2905690 RepID=A0ABZ2KMD1_9BACT